MDAVLVKENYELYTRLQNNKRKQLLSFIYNQARKYKELMDFSGLKPGSLYHHLSILEPLIEKKSHGLYSITELGMTIVEDMNLIETKEIKPIIRPSVAVNYRVDKIDNIPFVEETKSMTEDNLSLIWLGKSNYFILLIVVSISIAMAIQGIALAGSAIYATGIELAIKFDIAAFTLGIFGLYIIESIKQAYPLYNRIQFIITIRLMSMIPGTVMSIGLFLLFTSNIVPSASIYPWLFVISLILGTITSSIGISYLRGQSIQKSVDLAILMSIMDLLLGSIFLLS